MESRSSQRWFSAHGPAAYWDQAGALDCIAAAAAKQKGASVCVCLCVCVMGRGQAGGADLDLSEHKALLYSASHSPQHEKHSCLSGFFPWFTSILLRSYPCQEQQGFDQAPSVISDGTKFSFTCLLGSAELVPLLHQWLCHCHHRHCFLVQGLALWQFTAYLLAWYYLWMLCDDCIPRRKHCD